MAKTHVVPLFIQISQDVMKKIVRKELKPGDKLPSAREYAEQQQINPNTVIHAFRELELNGITESRRGLGTFIREDLPFAKLKNELLLTACRTFFDEITALGADLNSVDPILKELSHDR